MDGRRLGINEDTGRTPATARLMCSQAGYINTTILPEECHNARFGAAQYVKAKWGVTVTP